MVCVAPVFFADIHLKSDTFDSAVVFAIVPGRPSWFLSTSFKISRTWLQHCLRRISELFQVEYAVISSERVVTCLNSDYLITMAYRLSQKVEIVENECLRVKKIIHQLWTPTNFYQFVPLPSSKNCAFEPFVLSPDTPSASPSQRFGSPSDSACWPPTPLFDTVHFQNCAL